LPTPGISCFPPNQTIEDFSHVVKTEVKGGIDFYMTKNPVYVKDRKKFLYIKGKCFSNAPLSRSLSNFLTYQRWFSQSQTDILKPMFRI